MVAHLIIFELVIQLVLTLFRYEIYMWALRSKDWIVGSFKITMQLCIDLDIISELRFDYLVHFIWA